VTVIVGFVPTAVGRAALDAAKIEARRRGDRLVIVSSFKGGDTFTREDDRDAGNEAEAIRRELTKEGYDFEIVTLVRGQEPTDDLLDIADRHEAPLLVIGLRRRSAIGKLVLGSNAQRILLEADCPVLSVKAPRGS